MNPVRAHTAATSTSTSTCGRRAARGAARPATAAAAARLDARARGRAGLRRRPARPRLGCRRDQAIGDGLDLALISLSSAARDRAAAARRGRRAARRLPRGRARAAARRSAPGPRTCLTELDPDALAGELDRGLRRARSCPRTRCRTSTATPAWRRCSTCSRRPSRPLFDPSRARRAHAAGAPPWWPAIVSYVQQMHEAWYAFRRVRPPAAPAAAGLLRDAGRARAAARRAAARARRPCGQSSTTTCSSRSRRTARGRSTRPSACSASTCSSTAPTGRTRHRPCPTSARAAAAAIRGANPAPSPRPQRRCLMTWQSIPARNLDRAELESSSSTSWPREPERWREQRLVLRPGAPFRVAVSRRPRRRVVAVLDAASTTRAGTTTTSRRGRCAWCDGALMESSPRIGGERRGPHGARGAVVLVRPRPHPPPRRPRMSGRCRSTPTRRRCGGWAQYAIDGDGVMRRLSISYADELRPLEDPVAA